MYPTTLVVEFYDVASATCDLCKAHEESERQFNE